MGQLRVSPEAEQDLVEIWLYIADDSPENADRFLDRLATIAERLQISPAWVVQRQHRLPPLRPLPPPGLGRRPSRGWRRRAPVAAPPPKLERRQKVRNSFSSNWTFS